jgi:hypothetical protein
VGAKGKVVCGGLASVTWCRDGGRCSDDVICRVLCVSKASVKAGRVGGAGVGARGALRKLRATWNIGQGDSSVYGRSASVADFVDLRGASFVRRHSAIFCVLLYLRTSSTCSSVPQHHLFRISCSGGAYSNTIMSEQRVR